MKNLTSVAYERVPSKPQQALWFANSITVNIARYYNHALACLVLLLLLLLLAIVVQAAGAATPTYA